jgi:hypothetical protein
MKLSRKAKAVKKASKAALKQKTPAELKAAVTAKEV